MSDLNVEIWLQGIDDYILHAPDLGLIFSQIPGNVCMSRNWTTDYRRQYVESAMCDCCGSKLMNTQVYRNNIFMICLNCLYLADNAINNRYLYRFPKTTAVIVSINDKYLLTWNYHLHAMTKWNTYWYYDIENIGNFNKPETKTCAYCKHSLCSTPSFCLMRRTITHEKVPILIKKYHLITVIDHINNVPDIWVEIFTILLMLLPRSPQK